MIAKEELRRLYWDEGLTARAIGTMHGVSGTTIRRWMRKHSIPRRTSAEIRRRLLCTAEELHRLYWDEGLSAAAIGDMHDVTPGAVYRLMRKHGVPCRWPGGVAPDGSTCQNGDGYIRIKVNGKWVLEHRHLMEQHQGRKLELFEDVHHINGDRADNRIENLQILDRDEHASLHQSGQEPRVNEATLRRLYLDEGLSTTAIGRRYGVCSSTVGRWMTRYGIRLRVHTATRLKQRPSEAEMRRAYWEEGRSSTEIARELGIHPTTVITWLRDYGIRIRSQTEAVRLGVQQRTKNQQSAIQTRGRDV
jgi:transposase-like protein